GRECVDYYEELAGLSGDGKRSSNFVQQEVLRTLNERNITLEAFPVRPPALSELVKAVSAGDIEITRAKEVFNEMVTSGKPAAEIMKAKGIEKVDASELTKLCEELVAA